LTAKTATFHFSKSDKQERSRKSATLSALIQRSSIIRSLFKQADQERRPVNTSEIIREVLTSVRHELEDQEISSHPELVSELPFVEGDRRNASIVSVAPKYNSGIRRP
jgi:hypothetical protein